MNFVLIYGPPAAGKLTVATELAKQTGYVLIDNHKVVDYLVELFPREYPQFEQLRTELGRQVRLDIFEVAAKADRDMIVTSAPISQGSFDYFRRVRAAVEDNGGTVCLVHLLPRQEVLEQRVSQPSRLNKKIDNVARLHDMYKRTDEVLRTFPDMPHLVLDNSELSPTAAAQSIIEHYSLTYRVPTGLESR